MELPKKRERKVLMRKTARPYPTIRLDGRLTVHAGIYYTNKNLILLERDRRWPQTAVSNLMHEETHWVQDMYLTARECDIYFKGMPKKVNKRIVEKMAEEMAKEITGRIFPKE